MKHYDKNQTFVFKLNITLNKKGKDYDEAMKQVIQDVNQLNQGDVKIDKIEGDHPVLSL